MNRTFPKRYVPKPRPTKCTCGHHDKQHHFTGTIGSPNTELYGECNICFCPHFPDGKKKDPRVKARKYMIRVKESPTQWKFWKKR